MHPGSALAPQAEAELESSQSLPLARFAHSVLLASVSDDPGANEMQTGARSPLRLLQVSRQHPVVQDPLLTYLRSQSAEYVGLHHALLKFGWSPFSV
jgi:hypothetical protein